jgi:hypothetical protein
MFDWIFLTFMECAMRGTWAPTNDGVTGQEKLESNTLEYRSRSSDAEVWIVRQDGTKRAFSFKTIGRVWIGNGMIKYYNADLHEELSIDEDERAGCTIRSKLDFSGTN